jgi:hypothetical protein
VSLSLRTVQTSRAHVKREGLIHDFHEPNSDTVSSSTAVFAQGAHAIRLELHSFLDSACSRDITRRACTVCVEFKYLNRKLNANMQ